MGMWKICKLLFVGFAGWVMITNGYAVNPFGSDDIRKRFTDDRVVNLVAAVNANDFPAANKLVAEGANINAVGVGGITPLLWIMVNTLDVRKIEYMLRAGADPNYRDEESGVSAMYFAAGGNRADILELLLKNRGNPNLFGPRDESLLMVAVGQLREKNLELLLKYGADLNVSNRHNETVADKAAGYGQFDLVAKLLDLGLTYNLQGLAKTVELRKVPPHSEEQRWKDKVIEMLKARGVTFPAFIPCYPPGDPRRKEENCKRFAR